MDSHVRPGRVDEKHYLEELQRRASLSNEGDREALLANPDAIDLPKLQLELGQVIVLEVDSRVAGFAVVIPREGGGSELDGLFVEPDLWNLGFGRRLVEEAKTIARNDGQGWLHVIGNFHAEGFYLKCGFIPEGTIETRFGTGLLMRCSVDQRTKRIRWDL